MIFVRLNNLEYIYSRFSIHRQSITHITEMKEQKLIVSMCTEFKLAIWGFANN